MQRWILARLRNRRFFSLAGLNQSIRELIEQLNDRTLRGWDTTRRKMFEQLARPARIRFRRRRMSMPPGSAAG